MPITREALMAAIEAEGNSTGTPRPASFSALWTGASPLTDWPAQISTEIDLLNKRAAQAIEGSLAEAVRELTNPTIGMMDRLYSAHRTTDIHTVPASALLPVQPKNEQAFRRARFFQCLNGSSAAGLPEESTKVRPAGRQGTGAFPNRESFDEVVISLMVGRIERSRPTSQTAMAEAFPNLLSKSSIDYWMRKKGRRWADLYAVAYQRVIERAIHTTE